MAEAVYFLSAATSILCTVQLFRAFSRSRMPLLFWSGLCFVGLAANNLLLLVDLVFSPKGDLSIARNLTGLVGTALLLFGMIWSRARLTEPSP